MLLIKLLIGLGLLTIPFFSVGGYDTREPKMALAMVFAAAISLSAIFILGLKPIRNKWAIFFMGFLAVNILLAPKIAFFLIDRQIVSPWLWETGFKMLLFFLLFATFVSFPMDQHDRKVFYSIMVFSGFLMASYAILQWLGIEQFFRSLKNFQPNQVGLVCGTLGQPTLLAPFIAMLVPLAFYLRRYFFAAVMVAAVILTHSDMGGGALVLSLLILLALKSKARAVTFCVVSAVVLITAVSFYPKYRNVIEDNGRFNIWHMILNSVNSPIAGENTPSYSLTGLGTGSYSYIFHYQMKDPGVKTFLQAHNEYLEILFDLGYVGLFLFLMALFWVFKNHIPSFSSINLLTNEIRVLFSSVFCIALGSIGNFNWHLAPHLFYSLFIVGILSKARREL